MKANLKGLTGFKGLLLMHGEKVGIALVGLLALWLVYSSLSVPSLESKFQATNLQQEITQTTSTVNDTKWPEEGSEEATNVKYAKQIAQTADPVVEADPYRIAGTGFAPVIPPTQRRTDPKLLNAVEVRAIGGSGLFAFSDDEIRKQQELRRVALEEERARDAEKMAQEQQRDAERGRSGRRGREEASPYGTMVDPEHPDRRMIQGMARAAGVQLQGGERIERAYWACVVAKVPIREQLEQYLDAFENARGFDPATDFPQYLGYFVERAEVVRGKPLEWKDVELYDPQGKRIARGVGTSSVQDLYKIAQEQWAGQPVEPVDPRYMDSVLSLPLPPLVGRDFGADATHPDIPLAIHAPPMEAEPVAEQTPKAAESDDPGALFRADPSQQSFGPRPGGFGPPMGGMPRGEFSGYGRGGPSPYMGPDSMSRSPYSGASEYGGPGYGGPSAQSALPRGVDFKLLRFFDYSVEPGKKYKYRVRLVLADPNASHPDSTLDPAVQDRLRVSKRRIFRQVEQWSEPSPTVGIPLAGVVQLAEVRARSEKFNDEPVVKLMVETFDVAADGTAVHIAKEKDYRRGYVVNLQEKMDYTGDGDRWIDTFDDPYSIMTGMTLLDVNGGDKLTKDYSAPARVMLMDASGELSIRKELDDSMSVEYLRLLFSDKKRDGEDGMMPGMMPMMGPEGFRAPR